MVQSLYEADGRRLDGPGMPDLWGAFEKGKQNRALTKRMESGAESDAIRVKSDALDLKGKPRKMEQAEQTNDILLERYGLDLMDQHTKYALGEMVHVHTFNDYIRLLDSAQTNRGLPSEIAEGMLSYFPQDEIEANPALRDDPEFFKKFKEQILYDTQNYEATLARKKADYEHGLGMKSDKANNDSRVKVAEMNNASREKVAGMHYGGIDAEGNPIPGSQYRGASRSGTRSRSSGSPSYSDKDGGEAAFMDGATREQYEKDWREIDKMTGEFTGPLKEGAPKNYAEYVRQERGAWADMQGSSRPVSAADIFKSIKEMKEPPTPEEMEETYAELPPDTATVLRMMMAQDDPAFDPTPLSEKEKAEKEALYPKSKVDRLQAKQDARQKAIFDANPKEKTPSAWDIFTGKDADTKEKKPSSKENKPSSGLQQYLDLPNEEKRKTIKKTFDKFVSFMSGESKIDPEEAVKNEEELIAAIRAERIYRRGKR